MFSETSSFEGTNDEGKGSSECMNDIGSEKVSNYVKNPGKPIQTERPTFSRVFYGHSGHRYSNKNAVRSSEQFSVKNSADKAKVEGAHFRSEPDGFSFGDHCSNGNLKKDFGSCTTNSCSLSGGNQPRSHYNNRYPKDNVYKNFDRQLPGGSGKCDQAGDFRAPVAHLDGDVVRSEIKVSTSRNPEFADDNTSTTRDQNFRYQRYAHSSEGQHYRFNHGGRRGLWPRYRKQHGNEGGSCGFDGGGGGSGGGGGGGGIDGSSQKHLVTSVGDVYNEKRLRCAETEAGDHVGLAKDQSHSGDSRRDQNNHFRPDYSGRGRYRGYGRAGFRPDNADNRSAGRRQYAQDYGKKHYGTNNEPVKYLRGDDGGSGDGFSGKTLEFYRRKTTLEDRNSRERDALACFHSQGQLNSKEPATEVKVKEPVHSTFAATSPSAPVKNVWKDRQEFYEGALPKSKEEEDEMLEAALKLSQLDVEGELIQPLVIFFLFQVQQLPIFSFAIIHISDVKYYFMFDLLD